MLLTFANKSVQKSSIFTTKANFERSLLKYSAHKAGAIVIHRKLKENEATSPCTHYSCFHEDDFIKIVRHLLKS